MEWYIPITLLPGIYLLLLSTVTLTVSLNEFESSENTATAIPKIYQSY